MDKPKKVRGVRQVRFSSIDQDKAVCMTLTDTIGKRTHHLINPETLNAILQPALALAAQWAEDPDLAIDTLVGPKHALPAHRLEIAEGRAPSEAAINIQVGPVQLTYLASVETVMGAIGPFLEAVEPDPNKGPKPH